MRTPIASAFSVPSTCAKLKPGINFMLAKQNVKSVGECHKFEPSKKMLRKMDSSIYKAADIAELDVDPNKFITAV